MVIKCKRCGGDLNITEESNICECEYCGTKQTVPIVDNEKKINLFNRANRLRMNAEFDKAAAVYESIAAEFPEEAEAYWGLCLCTYGVEYVDDPGTGEKKPTCHRTLPMSIMEDNNFEQACDNADAIARRVYREEAKDIDRIQKDILSIVANEDPYDVFICYKETAEEGGRTEDSVLAQEIYDALTEKGLKVFFSRITLEDKLGQQYEPYIYAALSSAKIMLAIGTRFEHYDAVWVKNEWMRFLSMMKTDKNKTLIPCYKAIDAYDMPKEFKNLQGQDMGKLGWLQDLVRGVMKLCGKEEKTVSGNTVRSQADEINIEKLMKRVMLFLEDGEFDQASSYLDKILDHNPEYAPAYLGKLFVKYRLHNEKELAEKYIEFDSDPNWEKALRFATEEQRKKYEKIMDDAAKAKENKEKESAYTAAITAYSKALTADEYDSAACIFDRILEYKDSKQKSEDARNKAKELIYRDAIAKRSIAKGTEDYDTVIQMLLPIKDYEDCDQIIAECEQAKKMELLIAQKQAEAPDIINRLKAAFREAEKPYDKSRYRIETLKKTVKEAEEKAHTIEILTNKYKEELKNLKGLFSGKRRGELESIISQKEEELKSIHETIVQTSEELKTEESKAIQKPDIQKMILGAVDICLDAHLYGDALQWYLQLSKSKDEIAEFKYMVAGQCYNEKEYKRAFLLYDQIRGYKDVDTLLQNNEILHSLADREVKVAPYRKYRNVVTFGHYNQDNNPGNVQKEIEWIVLKVKDGRSLLLSQYGLEAREFDSKRKDVSWEDSTIRKWLNNEFLNSAFSTKEQAVIQTTTVSNSDSVNVSGAWTITGKEETQDKMFLLSYHEAIELYFSSDKTRKCTPTKYLMGKLSNIPKGIYGNAIEDGACWWWLRTPELDGRVCTVDCKGTKFYSRQANDNTVCVRPAFWLDLDKLLDIV